MIKKLTYLIIFCLILPAPITVIADDVTVTVLLGQARYKTFNSNDWQPISNIRANQVSAQSYLQLAPGSKVRITTKGRSVVQNGPANIRLSQVTNHQAVNTIERYVDMNSSFAINQNRRNSVTVISGLRGDDVLGVDDNNTNSDGFDELVLDQNDFIAKELCSNMESFLSSNKDAINLDQKKKIDELLNTYNGKYKVQLQYYAGVVNKMLGFSEKAKQRFQLVLNSQTEIVLRDKARLGYGLVLLQHGQLDELETFIVPLLNDKITTSPGAAIYFLGVTSALIRGEKALAKTRTQAMVEYYPEDALTLSALVQVED